MATIAPLDALRARYLDALLVGDRREALRLLLEEGVAKGVSAPNLHLDVVAAAQREIGRLWQENAISVADEHVASGISQLALAQLYSHFVHAPRTGKRVVVACVEGELHDMGARIAADFLEASGFEVRMLGASVPTASLVSHVRAAKADVVALSATMSFHLPALREALRQLRASCGPALPIVVGGDAVLGDDALDADLRVYRAGPTAEDLVTLVRQILAVR